MVETKTLTKIYQSESLVDSPLYSFIRDNPLESLVDLEQGDGPFEIIKAYFHEQKAYLEIDKRVFTELLKGERGAGEMFNVQTKDCLLYKCITEFPCLR